MKGTNDDDLRRSICGAANDYAALAKIHSSVVSDFVRGEDARASRLIRDSSLALVQAARTKKDCESAAKLIFNLLSKCIQDRSTGPKSRKVFVFFVANLLLKLYFRLGIVGPGQFDSISRNIISSGVRFSEYGKADQVGYRYYLGRYYLSQQQYRRARSHLLGAFTNCTNMAPANKRLILLYLTATSLPIGIFTSPDLLRMSGLAEYFQPLMVALQKGDYQAYHAHLEKHEDWFSRYEIFLYLDQRCDMILYRSLFRRTFMLSDTSAQKTPNIKLVMLLCALRWATRDHTWTLMDCEALCISMIDTGYIKGYIHHQSQLLVLDKRDEKKFGFPDVSGVHVAQFDNDDESQFVT
jgi:nuclear mRNA export protein PCID2/THP1